ncbi:MAG: MBL fold metallo-hydrolase [Deltaproteobacteria bacterium]|nr:MBL fold metallo-hydrolase [Deltaproteobacteria bacterium]
MKKQIFVLLVLVFCFHLTSCNNMTESIIKKRMEQQQEQITSFKDGRLHVILVGTGGPLPNEKRISATSIAVIAGKEFILVDVGPGVVRNMGLQGLPLGSITAVFLTHFHSDHISDLGELAFMSWAQGRTRQKLMVFGPEGVKQVVNGYNIAYSLDSSYRVAHHGEEIMPSPAAGIVANTLSIPDPKIDVPFYNHNGLIVSVFLVDHHPAEPAVGYRFEYKGKVVVITGDTKKTETLANHAKAADLFICDALDVKLVETMSRVAAETKQPRLAAQLHDIQDYHMTPVQAAEVAKKAGVRKLIFVHIVPPLTNFVAKNSFLAGVDDIYDGDIILGEDGMTFSLNPQY